MSSGKEIIMGNNLKMDAIVPTTIDAFGDGYTFLNVNSFTVAQANQIKEAYKDVCSRHEVIERVVNEKTGEITRRVTYAASAPMAMKPYDMKIKTQVSELITIQNNFRYTLRLLKYVKQSFKDRFISRTSLVKEYFIAFKTTKDNIQEKRRVRHMVLFEYPAVAISEPFKTFLIGTPINKWCQAGEWLPNGVYGIPKEKERELIYLRSLAIKELEDFFNRKKEDALEWDEYADREIERLWYVTKDNKLPDMESYHHLDGEDKNG